MMRNSIRWRLPLSYAGVALLAAVSLGAVLLLILQSFYRRLELDYLTNNALAISETIQPFLRPEIPNSVLESHLKGLAFLTRTRIQMWDPDGLLLADSTTAEGDPTTTLSIQVDQGDSSQEFQRTVVGDTQETSYQTTILIGEEGSIQYGSKVSTTSSGADPLEARLPAVGTPFGLGLGVGFSDEGRRSNLEVGVPVREEVSQESRGELILSEGPAYGREVLASVAWGWGIASAVAVTLGALTGWSISKRLSEPLLSLAGVTGRMAAGDLSARAVVGRQDELGQLGDSFNAMADQIELLVGTLRRFVADAAHGLQTPLTALRTDVELIESEQQAGPGYTRAGRALDQIARLELLTRNMLELARVESETPDLPRISLDFGALVRAVSEPFAARAEYHGIQFSVDTPNEGVQVPGVETQLRVVVENLLDNAVKFTPAGGEVQVRVTAALESARLEVQDTGIGIPAEDLPQAGDRFFRSGNAAGYPGSGLGLAIVKAVITRHGGQFLLESGAWGTRLAILLPIQAD